MSVKNCFIRGSVVRYVQLPADECDTQILQDAARKEAAQSKQRWYCFIGFLELCFSNKCTKLADSMWISLQDPVITVQEGVSH